MPSGKERTSKMRYYEGSLAPQLDQEELAPVVARPAVFTSYAGGGRDTSARHEASGAMFPLVALALALIIVFCAIGAARVTLTAGTVALRQGSETVSSQIKDLHTLNNDLQIERSLFSGSDRIGRIATQNLGMVHASEVERIELD